MRAVFAIGQEPERDDGLRQVPVNDETRPTEATVRYVRRALDEDRHRANEREALAQRVRQHLRDAASPYREAESA